MADCIINGRRYRIAGESPTDSSLARVRIELELPRPAPKPLARLHLVKSPLAAPTSGGE